MTAQPRISSATGIRAYSLVGISRGIKVFIEPLGTVVASVSTGLGLTIEELITVLTDPVSLTVVEILTKENLTDRVGVDGIEATTKLIEVEKIGVIGIQKDVLMSLGLVLFSTSLPN